MVNFETNSKISNDNILGSTNFRHNLSILPCGVDFSVTCQYKSLPYENYHSLVKWFSRKCCGCVSQSQKAPEALLGEASQLEG